MDTKEIRDLKKQRAYELREIARLEKRREEVLSKRVRDEARRRRFVARIDHEIEEARKLLAVAEGNLLGLGERPADAGLRPEPSGWPGRNPRLPEAEARGGDVDIGDK